MEYTKHREYRKVSRATLLYTYDRSLCGFYMVVRLPHSLESMWFITMYSTLFLPNIESSVKSL